MGRVGCPATLPAPSRQPPGGEMRATTSTAAGDAPRASGEGVARRLPTEERLGECEAGLELSAEGWSSLPKALPGTASGGLASGCGESSSALATCCIWLERARRWLESWSTWLGLGLGIGIGIGLG